MHDDLRLLDEFGRNFFLSFFSFNCLKMVPRDLVYVAKY